ncbi:tyrosine-type recombinase/integrase [Pengzhenrongella frigida]|uniref:Site-specific integrase n=1 Tax=Pengzhenrongella frigida TaxID=1259133 RepID=A0A4V1ZGZ6_9MICO|nr:site-specific integrase [Cellulomonas sp. HLT2-17]RYV50274.1 site-specific integrase [Cellulomonas sp. HLT2-17]
MASITKRPDGVWRARYRDEVGREYSKHFQRKLDAQRWLNEVTTAVGTGTYLDPEIARTTVEEWCTSWLAGYGTRRASTVRQGRVHVARIVAEFGPRRLANVRPSHVKAWTAKLKAEGVSDSYVYALHARLAQIMADAVHDGLIARSPCSRRTSPGAGKQRPYVATEIQVWALVDTVPEYLQPAVLLAAFAGLRVAAVCGLRVTDVDFARGVINPAVQYPQEPLKTATARIAIPIPQALVVELADGAGGRKWIVETSAGEQVAPWKIDRAVRAARAALKARAEKTVQQPTAELVEVEAARAAALPVGFRFHDLRHFYASLLIASGADVKVVQARLRHASAKTTLDTYAHLWPDTEESTRAAVGAAMAARADSVRTKTSS